MRTGDQSLDSDSDTDVTSSSSSSGSDFFRESSKKHGLKRKRSRSTTRDDVISSGSSSDDGDKHRKSRSSRVKGRKSSRRKEREDKEKNKDKKRRSKGSDEKHERRNRKKEKRDREKRKRRSQDPDSITEKEESSTQLLSKSPFQLANEAQLQQKALVWRNVEIAKARLASGELQKKKHEQMEMQRLYGAVDWREKKKLRAEKSRLERTIAAGRKLASIEERENARMDAFRVALGLPTAEAQRQAEWRAEATRALAEAEALNKDSSSPSISRVSSKSPKVIGPRLPS
ncbi:hypothetical protein MPTK1_1g23530 [Marchantia polymorpha subsp. ruderalis]|uniref:Uncharacterized protein n=2 Tax=Marchantia polymorpha TaxID=3197 RepID=A0AAF6ATH5_MARPO|nr:hypothetical protein MARPO_0065s0024 [Marchantia polymorpha]BBM99745.1 hypothetical protein Mp_1g23530 [Marchantia polymorpha subsp. ruderalis]|eukprot:PTQ36209.1 hypothetical protein MARPO_0065s0024 [Marchantia polymorpha]